MTRKKPEQFWRKFPPSQPNETTWEVEFWPHRGFKKGPRAGNCGFGTYRSMREVEQAVKRMEKFCAKHRKPRDEVRVYMVYTERQRVH